MTWYEHLYGVLAVLACLGIGFGGLLIYALCVISSEADRYWEDLHNGNKRNK